MAINWGNDTMYGDAGNDFLHGSAGRDSLRPGNDNLSRDVLSGHGGDDFLDTLDSFPNDIVHGGDGVDDCRWRDPGESITACETL